MHIRSSLGLLAGCVVAAGLSTSASAASYSALYAFGDSLSDTGNLHALIGIPAPPYSAGRFSNGPVWAQDLAGALHLGPLTASLSGGTDYAYGDAQTGATPVNPTASIIDLPSQVAQYQAAHPTPGPNALYTVWIGANDLFGVLGSPDPLAFAAPTISAAVANVVASIGSLAAGGAKDFLVLDVPDLGNTPAVLADGPVASAFATLLSREYDMALFGAVEGLAATDGLDLKTLDTFALLDAVIADPATYGFTDVTSPCWTGSYAGDDGTLCSTSQAEQDQHLFWDQVHPTERGHALIAAGAFAEVPEPTTLALLAAGLIGLAATRLRRQQFVERPLLR